MSDKAFQSFPNKSLLDIHRQGPITESWCFMGLKSGLRNEFFLVVVGLFRAAPEVYGSSQARGHIGASSASLHHSHCHGNMGSEPCLRP